MKFSSRAQVESLSRFRSEKFLTLSFFLDTDKHRLSKKEILVSAKNLLADARTRLDGPGHRQGEEGLAWRPTWTPSRTSWPRTPGRTAPDWPSMPAPGRSFWKVLSLPEAPRNRVVFDRNPYVRPLTLILDEFQRLIAFLIDRREAKWYAVVMGEITLLDEMKTDVPKKVKGGGEREEARRIERHVERGPARSLQESGPEDVRAVQEERLPRLRPGLSRQPRRRDRAAPPSLRPGAAAGLAAGQAGRCPRRRPQGNPGPGAGHQEGARRRRSSSASRPSWRRAAGPAPASRTACKALARARSRP